MPTKPHILMIVVDQLRHDCVGYANAYPVRTPHIDALAKRGTIFRAAYTPIPLCCPARQSMLTGKRPEALGTHWNYDLGPRIPALDPGQYTWTRHLQQNGYRSAYVGKWHVSPDFDPTSFGFDSYVSEDDYAAFVTSKHPGLVYTNGYFGEVDPLPLRDTRTHWLAQRTMDALDALSGQEGPWLVRMDLPEPHLPCRPAAPFDTLFDPARVPRWSNFHDDFKAKPYIQRQQLVTWRIEDYTWDDWAPIVARYYAAIAQVDDAIGLVLSHLRRLGLEEDTLIVFTSDHGDMCGAHRMIDKHYVLYDDIVRVPMVLSGPGVPAGGVVDDFVYNALDLPPTLLEAVGLEPSGAFHGRSLAPLLRGEDVPNWRTHVVSTYNGQQFGLYSQRMLRTGDWKYVWNATDTDELYDLTADPDELVNRIDEPDLAPLLKDMRVRLHEDLVSQGDKLLDNQWMRDQLLNSRKLGARTGGPRP